MKYEPKFVLSYPSQRHGAPSCFPIGYDTRNLMDISCIMDEWAKYINTQTGEKIDCKIFADQMSILDREW